jgi:hypothetical protein
MTLWLAPLAFVFTLSAQTWPAVQPILAERCHACHQGSRAAASLALTDKKTVRDAGFTT